MSSSNVSRRLKSAPTARKPTAAKDYQPKRIVSDAVLAAADAATPEQFLAQLRALRESLRLSYRMIDARVAEKGMSRSTAWNMLNGDDLPSPKHLHLFLQACKVTPTETTLWLRERGRLVAAATTQPTKEPDTTAATSTKQPAADPSAPNSTTSDDVPERPLSNPAHPSAAPPTPTSALLSRNLHLIGALSVLIAVISASAIAMRVTNVPIEIITLSYGLIIVCIAAWTAVNQAFISRMPPPPPLPDRLHTDFDVYVGQPPPRHVTEFPGRARLASTPDHQTGAAPHERTA